ncbi:MAG: UDP-N-acetylmuramoyl-L-alanine--D-glutamate ligase [Legionellales bacterium]|jgi:UDP-N-acetylmuramoylalanine--D-glutamate ligase
MYIVVGLGITGLSVVRYLKKQNFDVMVMDSRENPPGLTEVKTEFPEIKCLLGRFDSALLATAQEIILSPGIALAHPDLHAAKQKNIPIVGDIELFARAVKKPVVAITGTNGKSTVTTMVGELARDAGVRVAIGGNLGKPALDLLDDNIDLYVLELSSFQLETTYSLAPSVAILLNITPDHDDRYPHLQDYINAKQHVFHHAQLAVYNRADPLTTPKLPVKQMQSFGLDVPNDHNLGIKEKQLVWGDKILFPADQLASQRPNFVNNALAALSVVCYFNWSFASAAQTLHAFKGLRHRCELVLNKNGVRWYNDSKATNVGATIAALMDVAADIKGQQIIILGGVGKGADFSDLTAPLNRYAKHVILLGEAQHEIADILSPALPRTHVIDLQHAVQLAAKLAQNGDAVVLAPACASFDMFKDYNDRGNQFVELVHAQK